MYLTSMTAQTKLSAKGQVVIPKDVRDRLGLIEGTVFEVIERGDEVVLRPRPAARGLTAAEALCEIQKIYRYDGPPVSIEEMREAAREQAVKNHIAKQRR
jgi:AbrB family looped-hinge helix DNA binding protein